ncbi:5-(carboxyamino)imidazole ribonucleotide synthase [Amphibacillus marinus]|uniref:N5-carboxyaminoimidazole ribonucleotide synthase n=1 Tax=Amphibacillus marinus TaxID=872970 RepID=A0A1H8LHP5_9BACI|nr:5-(carboxyamino)imidazole ribonucleotide synthase [Amphibacillus marinus]SEO04316.1 5-(carboxyamino)imidazole ribonucleotide synthase [Amphibacillus marinus]
MPKNRLDYGATIGIIGGGQLGRMMATTARHMGYRLIVLDPTPDCPAAQLADEQLVANYDDQLAIEQLANKADVVTYEFENVDLQAARYLEAKGLLPQGAHSLEITQDRELEKRAMVASGQSVAPFLIIKTKADLQRAVNEVGYPAVVKTCRGGYDGKGQHKVKTEHDLVAVETMLAANERLIYEGYIPFDCEISVVFTRSLAGEIVFFPIGENIHRDHILHTTTVPATVAPGVVDKARTAAHAIAEEIGVVGTFTLELFVRNNDIYINELAPRPHNSGHFTIEACNVSQFEQHIRAICGLPLAPVHFHGGAIMLNLLGDNIADAFAKIDQLPLAQIHMYGKAEIKPKRKVGHMTFVGQSRDELVALLTKENLI